MSKRAIIFFLLVLTLLLPLTAAASWWSDLILRDEFKAFVPKAADKAANEMDAQLVQLLNADGFGRETVNIVFTVPASLDNLEESSPLARQMSEEVSRAFVAKGYMVEEIRKGSEIVSKPKKGEFLLTRDTRQMASKNTSSVAIFTGTYTITSDSVRFNLRLLHTPSNSVLAMSSVTLPVTQEIVPLLADNGPPPPLRPSVQTRLR